MVLGRLHWEPRRLRLLVAYAASIVLALPAVALVFLSPVVADSTLASLVENFFGTVVLRAGVIFAPFLAAWLGRGLPRRRMLQVVALAALLNVVLVPVRETAYAWQALGRSPDQALVPFLEAPDFQPGQTFRLLRIGDGKVGMYQLIQHGGKLDSEFFPESLDRRSWPSLAAYRTFLRHRSVENVIIYFSYDARYRTNEHVLLEQLTASGCAARTLHNADFDLYRLNGSCE